MEGSRSDRGVLRLTGPEGLVALSVGTRVAADRPHRFRATLHASDIGSVRVNRLRTSAVSVSRTPESLTDDHSGYLVVLVAHSGEVRVAQRRALWRIGPGELGFVDFGAPFDVSLSGRGDYLFAYLPRAALTARGADVHALAGQVVGAEPLTRMFRGVLGQFAEIDLDPSGGAELALVEHAVVDLCVAVIRRAQRRTPEVTSAQNLSRAVEFVESHFGDPTLTVGRVATALNVSPRYLHKLFEGEEHSVYELIRRRRVAHGLELLTDPAHAHLSVAQIAARSGFVGPSQFGRAVRAITGGTPRDIRRDAAH